MLAATHAIAGAMIIKTSATPEIGYWLALLSHPLLDLFPHWDMNTRHAEKTKWFILWTSLVDAGVGFAIGWWLFSPIVEAKVLLTAMVLAQLPDWIEAPLHLFDWNFPPFSTVKKLQHYWHSKLDLPWGIVPQLFVLGAAVWLAAS